MERNRETILKLVPSIRMLLSGDTLKAGWFVPLEQLKETDSTKISNIIGQPVSRFSGSTNEVIETILRHKEVIETFLFLEGLGLIALSDNRSATVLEYNKVKKNTEEELWSVNNILNKGILYNKIIAITGGASGYGEGIARMLFDEGANIMIMDINEDAGQKLLKELNSKEVSNRAGFVKADVTDLKSVENAVYETVLAFSGLDVMISNAGVLKAGGVDEMDPDSFNFVTKVNYSGYFNCVKACVPVMKVQNQYSEGNFGDIIQINSKSGLEGSKKNFAYAGSKFGGIGLTQSFAMELMADRIKVNSICPGNFFEGPLWSDPQKGLFVQYLNAGKVPGAKSIADVKRHYESLVPAGRGCRIGDVVKAIKYVIDQEYETGQAIPVTGGQVMLG